MSCIYLESNFKLCIRKYNRKTEIKVSWRDFSSDIFFQGLSLACLVFVLLAKRNFWRSTFNTHMADFYGAAFYQHEPVRKQICIYVATPPTFGAGGIPCLPAALAEQFKSHCDLSRLVGIFTSVLVAAGRDFPSFSSLSSSSPGKMVIPCEHVYDDFLWNTKIEHGRAAGSGKMFINVRMPNDGFAYLPLQSSPLAPHIESSRPTVTRHGGIPFWHEVNTTTTLPDELQPFVVYFVNWLCGRSHNSLEALPQTIPDCTVQAWYNSEANRMDIELSAPTPPDGRECVWSLSFEPWSPVIKSKQSGIFGAADLIKFHAAQAAKMKKGK